MSAIKELWKRAPLWRICVIITFISGFLVFLFPSPLVKSHFASLSSISDNFWQLFPATQKPSNPDQKEHPPARSVEIPPMDAEFIGMVHFAGREIPLPFGKWHPLISYRDSTSRYEIITKLFVRYEKGIVTGLILAQSSPQEVPLSATRMMESECHNPFNFFNSGLPQDGHRVECWMTSPIRVAGNVLMTSNQALQDILGPQMHYTPAALQRLMIMSFMLPPVFVDAGWNYIEKGKSFGEVNFMSVHTLLSPAIPGKNIVPGVPENWSRADMNDNPAVVSFIQATRSWLYNFIPLLYRGYRGVIGKIPPPNPPLPDPAYHLQ